ncbi:MAG: UDP-N-acetylglucosamine 2-epimerase (non-hydrolyzing), partial [Planctomycetota bacterium]|nr:UDP-N-acetylglucosamine 2-epimerase (non-hydrolyzing) [Planctomycetota bacterium]
DVLVREQPDGVLVYGDTNSTLAGALAAVKLHIPVAHVEAGLRSFNRAMPEEINRVVTDHLACLHFCPTEAAVRNLADEGLRDQVHLVGDVMYDALCFNIGIAVRNSTILARWNLTPRQYLLATVHRAENTDDPARLSAILQALRSLAEAGHCVVFPVHPRTRQRLQACLPNPPRNLLLLEPASYLDMLRLEQQAQAVLTDSGGVQKEACWLRVPCVTLRDQTEWVETVTSGWNRLAGADPGVILEKVAEATQSRPPLAAHDDFAPAAPQIVEILLRGGAFCSPSRSGSA